MLLRRQKERGLPISGRPLYRHVLRLFCQAVATRLCLLHHGIPDAGSGEDIAGFSGIILYLLPEPGYIHLEQVGLANVVFTPHLLQYLVRGKHTARVTG